MARKYKRDRRGRFAGGGGTAGTGQKLTAGRRTTTSKQRSRRKKVLIGAAVGAGALAGAAAVSRNAGGSRDLLRAAAAAQRLANREGYNPGLRAGVISHHVSRASIDRKARLGKISKAKYVKKRGKINARASRAIRLHG